MNTFNKKISCIFLTLTLTLPATAMAYDSDQEDIYFSGYTPELFLERNAASKVGVTVINIAEYQRTVYETRLKIQSLLNTLQIEYNKKDNNDRIAFIAEKLSDIPYMFSGSTGEGDWQPFSSTYQSGAIHIKQDPIYRLDGLDCQTFVQIAMGLLYSNNIDEFDNTILKISYGAAGNLSGEIVHYFNRNNFIDGDWNPINQRNGWLKDVTSKGILSSYAQTTSAHITRQNWFRVQQNGIPTNVRVLNLDYGPSMVERFLKTYAALNYPHFDAEDVSIAYIPKEKIAIKQADGTYLPNQELLDKIPTPAVIEIVRDVKKWTIGDKNIKDVIGSELNISHMGLLYRQLFQRGEVIYQKITCYYGEDKQKICHVNPVICEKEKCDELIFAHAASGHPDGYFWYQQSDGTFLCTASKPPANVSYSQCNRVERQPLYNYLTDYQYDNYRYMNNKSIVGIHIEKLS